MTVVQTDSKIIIFIVLIIVAIALFKGVDVNR